MFLASPPVAAATLTVTTTQDRGGTCSLREAIEAVDVPSKRTACGPVSRRSNVIVLRSGRYRLTIPPAGPDDDTSGDLTVEGTAPLTITGAGVGATVIDAGGLGDRVLSVAGGARLTLVGLTIAGGHAAGCAAGGGIFNGGTLALDRVAVTGNTAGAGANGGCGGGNGGGVYNQGTLTVAGSTVWGNVAGAGGSGGSGGSGGGIYSQGTLSVIASTIYGNRAGAGGQGGAGGSGGGIFSTSGRLRVINSTLVGNFAGAGGDGGSGGAIAVVAAPSLVRNATVADNGVGAGGVGGGLFVQASTAADEMSLQNTIVAASVGSGCAGSVANGGHDLSYGDDTCPGRRGDPKLGPLKDNGGATETMAIGSGSAAIDRTVRSEDCPSADQRGVRRGRACDIGAYEFAIPTITIISPVENASYERGSRIVAGFRCDEGGVASAIATCRASTLRGHAIGTGRLGTVRFAVTAIDKSGNRATKTIDYVVFEYVNPLREVIGLTPRRIDLGVDYAGSGPLLAIGGGRVTMASDTDSGPPSCWAISCWPGGGIVVYRLLDGPFAGKYVYVAEHITVSVRVGQTVKAGQQIATLYPGYPWSEWGWAAGPGPEALAMTDGHRCPCSDPGGWSTIDGRTMNQLLVRLGAPSGYLQPGTPDQIMPAGWPSWPG